MSDGGETVQRDGACDRADAASAGGLRFPIRLVTIFGLSTDAYLAEPERGHRQATDTFPDDGGMKKHYAEAPIQAPHLIRRHCVDLTSSAWDPPPTGQIADPERTYGIDSAHLEAWIVPMASHCLVLDVCGRVTVAELQVLMADTFWRHRRLRFGDRNAIEWARDQLGGEVPTSGSIDSAHQVVFLEKARPFLRSRVSSEARTVQEALTSEVNMPLLVQIMARSSESSRPGTNAIVFPETSNRLQRTLCAVRESVSIITDRTNDEAHADILSTIQAVGARSRLGRLRARTFEALQEAAPREDSTSQSTNAISSEGLAERRATLTSLADELSRLQLSLSFGVEANMNAGLILPVRGVAEYHVALVEGMWLPQGVRFTSGMLDRLASVLQARETIARTEQQSLDEKLREDESRRAEAFQDLIAVLGAIFLTPSLVVGVYGANIRGLPGQDDPVGIVFLLGLMVTSAILTWLLLQMIRRLIANSRSRTGL